jgi:hypothetical protein
MSTMIETQRSLCWIKHCTPDGVRPRCASVIYKHATPHGVKPLAVKALVSIDSFETPIYPSVTSHFGLDLRALH